MRRQLGWYASRLSRMSPAEMAWRLREQMRKSADARRTWSWKQFGRHDGWTSEPSGLKLPDAMMGDFRRVTTSPAGEFFLLNQRWPPSARDWPRTIWHLDPVSGAFWPGKETFTFDVSYRHEPGKGDIKFVWELNRLQFLQTLAHDAAGGGDPEKWQLIASVLKGWMDANPPFRGVNWASGIEAASRLVSLFVVLGFAPEEVRRALAPLAGPFVAAHAFWLARYPSLYSSANNHRVAELAALFLACLKMPGLHDAERTMRESRKGLEREILCQFHRDGVGAEQSPTYAAYSLEWFVLAGIAADEAGVPFSKDYRGRAEAALTHLTWIIDDGGGVPPIGDDDEGRVLAFHPPEYVASVCALAQRWLNVALPKPEGMRIFAEGGYSVFRAPTSRGTLLAVFDHGPLGFLSIAAHGHADALSLWLHWGDEPVFADAGTYLYHAGGAVRDALRGTPAHNTLAIEGADQSRIAGPFNWSQHANSRVVEHGDTFVTAQNDGYRRRFGVEHRRMLRVEKGGDLSIADSLIGEPRNHGLRWSMGFTLAPGMSVTRHRQAIRLTTAAGRLLELSNVEGDRDWRISDVPYSPAFNVLASALRLSCSGVIAGRNQNIGTVRVRCVR